MSTDDATINTPAKPRKKRRKLRIFLITLGILVVIRLCLPYIILHFLNDKLAHMDGYYGHVDDVDLAIYRGAYVIKDIYLKKVDKEKKDTSDFFSTPAIDISVQWKAIFEGKIVGEIEFEKPDVKYEMSKTIGKGKDIKIDTLGADTTNLAKDTANGGDTTNLVQLIKDLLPISINRLAVNNGTIHYIDKTKDPLVDVKLTEFNAEALNLTNKPDPAVLLPATVKIDARLYDGKFTLNMKLDPLNKIPTFDMNATLTKTNLVNMNPLFQAYANFDLKAGSMSMYTEFAAKEGKFAGYVKPLIADLDIVQFEDEEGNFMQIAWEALIGSGAEILQNQREEQLATKLPIEGSFNKPDIGIIPAVWAVITNAFISALDPSLDNTISISNITTKPKDEKSLKDRIFNNDDKGDDKRSERRKKRKEKRDK